MKINPHFPALRSDPMALSGASRGKQIPSNPTILSCLVMPAIALLALATSARAAVPIPITNAGFENPAIAEGSYPTTIPGWTQGKYDVSAPTVWIAGGTLGGLFNVSTNEYASGNAPEGLNAAYTTASAGFDTGIEQVLTTTLQANASYNLSAKVGNPFVFTASLTANYRIEFLAGGVLLASATGASPADDSAFLTASLNHNTGAAPGQLGQPLAIRLIAVDFASGKEVDYDDVQLTATFSDPVATNGGPYNVPIPSGSLSLNGSASLPSDGATAITLYEWDLNNDGTFGDATGATPASIPYATLTGIWGMVAGANTIKLRVTDDNAKTSTSSTIVTLALPYYWDVNGTTAGFSTVVGAWNGSNLFWNTDATGGAGGTLIAAPTSEDALIIPQATTKTGSITVTGTQNAGSITFAANVGPTTTITGGTILLGGPGVSSGIFQASSGANTVASAMTLNSAVANLSISNTAAGLLTVSGAGNINGAATAGTQTLNIGSTSTGGITLSKIISNGVGGGNVALAINNTSTGITTLSAVNTFTGGLTIKAGTLSGTVANAFGGSAGVITLGDGSGSASATLNGGFAGTFANPITVASGSSGILRISNSAASIFSGAVTLGNNLTLAPTATHLLTLTGGITGTGNLIVSGTGTTAAVTLSTNPINPIGTITNQGTNTGATTISSAIGANVTAVVQNSATSQLILSGANEYTGPTTLSAGTLSVATSGNLGVPGANLVFDGGTLRITGTTLTSLSSLGRTVVLNSGKLVSMDIDDGANSFTMDQSLNQGGGGLTKLSPGTLVLDQVNTYSGMTTLSAGTLKLQNLGTGLSQTLGGLTLAGSDITLQSDNAGTGILSTTFGALTARTAGNTGNIVFTGGTVGTDNIINLTGAAGFIDRGVFFNGTDYAARNTIDGYVRALAYGTDPGTSAIDAIADATHVKLTSAVAGRVNDTLLSLHLAGSGVNYTMSSGTLTVPGILKSGGGSVTTISGGTAVTAGTGVELVARTDTASDLLAISTPVTGTGALTKSGTGTLTLSGVNTYSGATTVSGGKLEIGSAGQLNSGTYAGAIAIATGATVKSNSSATQTLSGIISGGGSLAKDNTGTLTVSAANTFTGPVTLNNGTLKANTSAGALGAGALVLNGGTLDFNHSAALNFGRPTTIGGNVTIISQKNAAGAGVGYTLGTLNIGAYTLNVTGGNVTSGTAGLTFGATTLTGAATFNVTKPAGGGNTQLTIPGGVNNGGYLLTVDGTGAITFASTANVITGAGGITKNGSGTLFLGAGGTTPAHNYTGPTVINGGVVMFYGNKTAGNFTLNNGMLTDYYRNTTAFTDGLGAGDNQIQIYGDSGFGGGNGNSTWRIGASGSVLRWGSSYFNPTSLKFLTPNDNMGPSTYGLVTLDNGLDLNGGARTIYVLPATGANAFNSWGKISGIIKDDAGGGSLIKTGGGQLILSAANTFNGVTTNSDGWLTLQNAAALQNSALDTVGSIAGTAAAGLATNQTALTLGGLTGNKALAAVFTTAATGGHASLVALTLNPGTGVTHSYSGIIANGTVARTLTKTGLGTQILTGTQAYTGPTAVNGGTLKLGAAGSIATSTSITLGAGGTLDTSDQATYAIPGAQPLAFGLDATDAGSSGRIQAAGLHISSAVVTYNITGPLDDPAYVLATYTSMTGSAFASVPAPPDGYALNYAYQGNKIALVQTDGSTFASWLSANGISQTIAEDHDNDGVANGVEYFLGGNTNTTGFTPLPGVINTAGTLSVTWTKAGDYTGVYGTDFFVETSATLGVGSWTMAATSGTPAAANTVHIDGNNVTYTFPTGTKNFVRLKVTGP